MITPSNVKAQQHMGRMLKPSRVYGIYIYLTVITLLSISQTRKGQVSLKKSVTHKSTTNYYT